MAPIYRATAGVEVPHKPVTETVVPIVILSSVANFLAWKIWDEMSVFVSKELLQCVGLSNPLPLVLQQLFLK
jgi:hypothetical protein